TRGSLAHGGRGAAGRDAPRQHARDLQEELRAPLRARSGNLARSPRGAHAPPAARPARRRGGPVALARAAQPGEQNATPSSTQPAIAARISESVVKRWLGSPSAARLL